jgi:katanin p60 ATPase-containing subunit A1
MSHRASEGGSQEHEGSRRMKTELLIQMDGLAKSNDHVFLLAASNLPWELDVAMLRRLEKRILIGLPDVEARKSMFEKSLPPDLIDGFGKHVVDEENGLDYEELAELTHGYSGSDINLVCKEAAMRPLRKLFSQLDKMSLNNESDSDESRKILNRDPVTQQDVELAISTTKPSCDLSLEAKYLDWESSHGSV